MSAKALHVNLLSPEERRSSSPIRARILLPIGAGICFAFVTVWAAWIGVSYLILSSQIGHVRTQIDEYRAQNLESERLKARLRDVEAESDQFAFYIHGRRTQGALLRELADVIPEGITLSAMSIPSQPAQELRRPLGSTLPALQGPTQTVEKMELRLTGLARREQDVFQLMQAMKRNAFTGLVEVVESPSDPAHESPRVLAFRQEAPATPNGRRDVFFDIVYTLKPREFVK